MSEKGRDSKILAHFPNGLRLGERVFIEGQATLNPKLFSIEFCKQEKDSIALGLYADFVAQTFTRATSIKNQKPVREQLRGVYYPFVSSKPFEIVITVLDNIFTIIINQLNVFYYSHKTSFLDITHLRVSGDVEIDQTRHFPGLYEPSQFWSSIELWDQPVPYVQKVNTKKGKKGEVVSSVTSFRFLVLVDIRPEEFNINFQASNDSLGKQIALHFSPRWPRGEKPVIVMNNRAKNSWGSEMRILNETERIDSNENYSDMIIRPGCLNDLVFTCQNNEWCILINGNRRLTYPNRIAIGSSLYYVSVNGDCAIRLFEMTE